MTPRGYEVLLEELRDLRNNARPSVIKAIAEAREHGDLSENAEYHAAREKQSFIEGRIIELEDTVGRAEVIDSSEFSGPEVRFGATVTLQDCDSEAEVIYQIVGEYEADIDKGQISLKAPLARAMIGKESGDIFEINIPSGTREYEIIKVEYS